MPLIDDLRAPLDEEQLTRRKFLGLLGSGALAVAAAGTGVVAVKFISPNVLYEPDTLVKVGRPENIAPGAVLSLPRHKLFVVRSAAGFYAMSSVCTHLGCMTRYEAADGRIFCPCHGSRYSLEGVVTGGPAPRPLPRLRIALEKGLLTVDLKKPVERDYYLKV